MASEEIANEIGKLVDHLRAGDDQKLSLTDIAGATEVLLQATQMYFRNIDTSVFQQVQQMSNLIVAMRSDIAHLGPEELKNEKIPRAGLELDAVLQNTEEATNTIMEATEEILSTDLSDTDASTEIVSNACMRIFEACSFQDITGQRVGKVVKTLTHIENALNSLRNNWADELNLGEPEFITAVDDGDTRADAILLNGPALAGEGADQNTVDALMGNSEALAPPESKPVEKEVKPKPEPEVATKVAEAPAVKKPAELSTVSNDSLPVKNLDDETNSQADIDALFD